MTQQTRVKSGSGLLNLRKTHFPKKKVSSKLGGGGNLVLFVVRGRAIFRGTFLTSFLEDFS